jgi:ketosteroid isomerase-like protein
MAEFLTVEDGRVTEIRQVYDVTAIDRFFPGLYDQ